MSDDAAEGLRERVAGLMLAHTEVGHDLGGFIICLCGARWMTATEHAKHKIAALLPLIAAEVARERAAVAEEISAFYDSERIWLTATWNGHESAMRSERYLDGIEAAIARTHKETT